MPSKLVKQTGPTEPAQANWPKQLSPTKWVSPPIALSGFCEKTNVHYWQGWISPPLAPTLEAVRRFCLVLMLWSLFGEQRSGFFSAFAAVDGT